MTEDINQFEGIKDWATMTPEERLDYLKIIHPEIIGMLK